MESDAKLGLLAGVAAVLVVAVVYFHKPAAEPAPAVRAALPAASADRPPPTPPASVGVPARAARPATARWDDD